MAGEKKRSTSSEPVASTMPTMAPADCEAVATSPPATTGTAALRSAIASFTLEYFPSPDEAQPLWFGACKPKYQDALQKLAAAHRPHLHAAGAGAARWLADAESWPVAERAAACIYLDQMGRNCVAVGGANADGAENLKVGCDAIALALAERLDAECFGGSGGGGAPVGGGVAWTAATFCFFTLVLRHRRTAASMARSRELLELALGGGWAGGPAEHSDAARGLCARFLEETEEAIRAVAAEAYIERALASDVPRVLHDPLAAAAPAPADGGAPADDPLIEELQLRVLDERCVRIAGNQRGFLARLQVSAPGCDAARAELLRDGTVQALERSLREVGIGPGSKHTLLLSLSGGVDSMAHAVMLRALQPVLGCSLCALHIRHPNRDDARDEEQWVTLCAQRVGIRLYSYAVELQRPHGGVRTGVSRERYEEVTKRLRFCMYKRALADASSAAGRSAGGAEEIDGGAIAEERVEMVVIGHHMDDADENRLAELGKSNIVQVDGMERVSQCLGVTVLRPLLQLRKDAMFKLADDVALPYMADSTPLWSRRGWTRRTLDAIDAAERPRLLESLRRIGASSGELSAQMDALHTQAAAPLLGTLPPLDASTCPGDCCSDAETTLESHAHDVAFLPMANVHSAIAALRDGIDELLGQIEGVAAVWNAAIESASAREAGIDGRRPEGVVCPLQRISLSRAALDVDAFIFAHAMKAQLKDGEVKRFLRGGPVALRSLTHLWGSIANRRQQTKAIWSTLHKRCPFVWLAEGTREPGLLLYSIELHQTLGESAPAAAGKGGHRSKKELLSACVSTLSLEE